MTAVSIATAYTSVLLFIAALSLGPIRILRSQNNPVSSYLRRDLGIWSAILAVIHTIAGLQVHLGGNIYLYFFPDNKQLIPIRIDTFGLTNYLGLLACSLMLLLLILSNNRAIGILTIERWKKWQRSSYAVAIAILLHGLLYQFLENRIGSYTIVLLLAFLLLGGLQLAGFLRHENPHEHR